MKKNFQITEQEKKEILEKHTLFKEALKSKVKKLMINEQDTPVEQDDSTPGGGEAFLRAARDKGCKIAKGGVLKNAPGKLTVLYKKADYDSANGYFKVGDELYIHDDFTFDVVTTDKDGNRTLAFQNRPWKCAALTAPIEQQVKTNIERTKQEGDWKERKDITDTDENVENPRMYEKKVVNGVTLYRNLSGAGIQAALTPRGQQILQKYQAAGGLLEKDVDPEKSKAYVKIKIGSTPDFSSDFYMYFDPTKTVRDPQIAKIIQTSIENLIPTDKKDCKKTIEDYYIDFKKKRPIEPNQLEAMKYKVQACKNEFYHDWGFLGGEKIDNILDIMSGVVSGGPSAYDEDSKWRIK